MCFTIFMSSKFHIMSLLVGIYKHFPAVKMASLTWFYYIAAHKTIHIYTDMLTVCIPYSVLVTDRPAALTNYINSSEHLLMMSQL